MTKQIWIALALAACTKAATPNEAEPKPGAKPRTNATVTLTAVTFADQCGDTAPSTPPPAPAPAVVAPSEPAQDPAREAHQRRRCEQTSMQLAIGALADTEIHIKSVEVIDESGKSLGTITASKPQRWVDGSAAYEPWDEKLAKGATARVTYALSQPNIDRYDSRDRTYTVKVVASIGGAEQPLQTTVMVVGQPPAVPT